MAVCTVSRDYWGNPLNVPEFSWELVRKALPIGARELRTPARSARRAAHKPPALPSLPSHRRIAVYVCNVSVGLVAMKLVNLPMFFAIRKLVSPTLLAYELVAFGKLPEQEVAVAVGLIAAGGSPEDEGRGGCPSRRWPSQRSRWVPGG